MTRLQRRISPAVLHTPASDDSVFEGWLQQEALTAVPFTHDVRLVFDCMQRDRQAWTTVRDLLTELVAGLPYQFLPPADRDEVVAATLFRLVTNDSTGRMRILRYRGRAPLKAWLRAVLVRECIDTGRRRPRLDVFASDAEAPTIEPTVAGCANEPIAMVRAALRAALAQCTDEERRLLVARYVERVPMQQLAASLNVHRAVLVRALGKAHHELRCRIEAALAQRKLLGADIAWLLDALPQFFDSSLRGALLAARAT